MLDTRKPHHRKDHKQWDDSTCQWCYTTSGMARVYGRQFERVNRECTCELWGHCRVCR